MKNISIEDRYNSFKESKVITAIRKNKFVQRYTTKGQVTGLIFKILMYALLFGISFVFLYPFLSILSTSLKTNADLHNVTVGWIPRSLKWENYMLAWDALKVNVYLKNSLWLTILPTIGHLVSCSVIGYGLSRYSFKGRNLLFFMVIMTMIVPSAVIVIPTYFVFANLGWVPETFLPILVPSFFGLGLKGGFYIFIFRQFYTNMPKELEDAARVDGCGPIRTFVQIVFPMVRSAYVTVLVFSVVWHWHDFYEPSIYLHSKLQPIPVALSAIINYVNTPPDEMEGTMEQLAEEMGRAESVINEAVLMAAVALVLIPLLVMFIVAQRQFIQGIERTGMTE